MFKASLISICFLLSAVFVTEASVLEVEDFFGDSYYELYSFDRSAGERLDWDYANALASSSTYMGRVGHLATVTSAAEDMFITQLNSSAIGGQIWLGGVRDSAGDFMWVNGEGPIPHVNGGPLYSNWADGEPNNYLGVSEDHLTTGFRGDQWNDEGYSRGAVNGYVVEYDLKTTAVPEPLSFHVLCAIGLIGLAIHKRRC